MTIERRVEHEMHAQLGTREADRVVYPSVYSVGHPRLTDEGRWMAVVLASGPGAVASHRSGAAVWRLLASERLEVTAPRPRIVRGIVVHRSHLREDEVAHVRGIPVTTVARTVVDLAAVVPMPLVERAINEAEYRGLLKAESLAELEERYSGRRGIRTITWIVEGLNAGVTRSELEARFLRFLRKGGLPLPRLNVNLVIDGRWIQCDCVWHERRVIVELDGRAAHATAAAFERDRARDRALAAHGWRVVRVTWRQMRDEPQALAADLSGILA
jgi:very-short-patch-repair endonuclease